MIGPGDKSQLKLGSKVRHQALEYSLCGRRGWLGLGMDDRDQEDERKNGDRE